MPSFFDDAESDEEDSLSVGQPRRSLPTNARASSSRAGAFETGADGGSGSRAFMSRLASPVAGSIAPQERYNRAGSTAADELEVEEHDNDMKRLGRIWTRERGTTVIMPWEDDLIDTVLDKLEQQQKLCQTLRGDPTTSEEEHFKIMLVETEMERVKFLVRGYLRTRLSKIEKYSHHITLTPELHTILSASELQHAQRFTELLHQHFSHSVLDSLPDWLRRMDDKHADGLSMISEPDRELPVLVLCLRDCGEIDLGRGDRAPLTQGTTHLIKYRLVEPWVLAGSLEVL